MFLGPIFCDLASHVLSNTAAAINVNKIIIIIIPAGGATVVAGVGVGGPSYDHGSTEVGLGLELKVKAL